MPHTVVRAREREIMVTPAPVAMVWNEPGRPHDAIATPGVTLGRGEALVEVELATVCGSDVHTVRGERPAPTPLVLGHEQVGRVVALGPEAVRADGSPLELGDRVVWSVSVSCGACDRCTRGIPQRCRSLAKYGHERVHRGWELSGGFATHVQLRAGTAIVPVGETLPATVAAPASCATATAVAALDAASHIALEGATVLITGAGMIGLTATAMATDAGATVVVSEPDPARRALALRFGATAVADSRVASSASEGVGGVLESVMRRGAAEPLVAIEASGSARAVRTAIGAVGVGGVVVLVGSVTPGSEVRIDPEDLVRRMVTLTGVHNYAPRHLVDAVDYLRHASLLRPFDELVGGTVTLDELDQALRAAASGLHVRVGVAPQRRH
ncbi:zinc-binding dehydrogenase [Agromyces atrinae]|uniref:alcohol dehydrogenase n=1 Tax=Agromyces atrinae TaxID=592376 RepID=A0A4V1R2M4_9MICO|nr:zinc-binding dehydrogenase [Agromyces atrinae]NYD68194.1 putative phosphonate catabolism associated alcohol dehydrogenase [Agromyces atrinae]RXZ87666.1 alcohol dehydrogenase [Agromyces atrinae]